MKKPLCPGQLSHSNPPQAQPTFPCMNRQLLSVGQKCKRQCAAPRLALHGGTWYTVKVHLHVCCLKCNNFVILSFNLETNRIYIKCVANLSFCYRKSGAFVPLAAFKIAPGTQCFQVISFLPSSQVKTQSIIFCSLIV